MTLSNHRFTMLSDDDVALCRAHSRAVASEPDHVVWARECGAPTTQQRAAWSREETYRAACDDFERVTLNQAQSDAYWQWQREAHAPTKAQIVDEALNTLAPAKPAAKQPAKSQDASGWRIGSDVPPHERVGLWHFRLGDGKYGGAGSRAVDAAAFNAQEWAAGHWQFRVAASGTKVGDPYDESKYTAPAQQPAQKASTHSVCIAENACFPIGSVITGSQDPEYWRPCDESGWVTHVPTADAVCPVPDGVRFETLRRDGSIAGDGWNPRNAWELGHSHSRAPVPGDIIAWRPIAQS